MVVLYGIHNAFLVVGDHIVSFIWRLFADTSMAKIDNESKRLAENTDLIDNTPDNEQSCSRKQNSNDLSQENYTTNTRSSSQEDMSFLKIGGKYYIRKSYRKNEETEIEVQKDEIVTILSKEERWVKVKKQDNSSGKTPIENIGKEFTPVKKTTSSINWTTIVIAALVLLAVGILVAKFESFHENDETTQIEVNLRQEMLKLERKFTAIPENVWTSLESCLNETLVKDIPCVITFLVNGSNDLMDFHRAIGDMCLKLLNQSGGYLFYNDLDLNADFSFSGCKEKLEKHKVMLISNMEKIRGETIGQFHSICDVHDPAVEPAVIVFMLNYSGINLKDKYYDNDNTFAFHLINEIWKNSIKSDDIDAITTRLINYVAKVN